MRKNIKNRTILQGVFILLPVIFLASASIRIYDSGRSLYSKIKLFSTIVERIKEDYVEDISSYELIDKAIEGMVSDLDPHSSYLTADRFDRWNQSFEGYTGIGVTFDIVRNKITIMSVITNGPSEKVGLRAGDRIVEIDGKSAIGMTRDEVPLKLMGEKGTKVEVDVERWGWENTQKFIIIRDEVHVESIPYAFIIHPGIGYINIIRFSATTGTELENHLMELRNQGMEKLILDLRNNGGGYLDAAVDVADKFLPGGKRIVYTKGRGQNSFREFFSTNKSTYAAMPLIVMIDRISASASEIVAGAMQDWDRGLIIGETSFGKGLVQSQYRFSDGSALLMTTARYYTPADRLIQRPYNGKSIEEYYLEITNDSLRAIWEENPSRPSFKTKILGRKVRGGGGITPDIFFNIPRDSIRTIVRRMLISPDRLFFTFVEDYVKNHPELRGDFNEFLRNYKPNGEILQNFLKYIRDQGFSISNRDFIQSKKDIQFFLKQFIADEIWGDEARYKVQLLRDRNLIETLDYLSNASELLARAYHFPRKR